MRFQWNPLEYGDALGLTRGPLSGRAPGKLTDQGLDWQGKINPFVSRKDLEHSNDIAPYVAGAIATFGGSAAPSAGAGAGDGVVGAEYPGGAGGSMDMWGAQSSPTDSASIFDQSPHGPMAARGFPYRPNGVMGMGGSQSQPYQPQTPIYPDDVEQYRARQALIEALMRGSQNA